ncbi:sigma-70 family RNA polymerase sigma factor [Devosia enhydra]|uniref:sigma-70 family RNA polymerase sigma factor n=1 Tax=Devosia enhydra TaxID=665118 RepID=UPI000930EC0D|nr:sigma-70 family RNA polymerase sigma factor [Devosia enhydra]
MSSDDLSQLLSRVALGDRAAFRRLYDLTGAKLFGVALRILRNRAEAEEALQEVYIKIWQRAGRFAGGGASPISWLVAVMRNHCLDRLRGRRPPAADVDAAYDIADQAPDPEMAAMAGDDSAGIARCLAELEPARADAVRGAYLDGLSYEELATRHSVPLNTMRTWLRRSLIRLRECLER